MIRITECPRDAMQGIGRHIPAAVKAKYISQLMKAGFDVIDFGSFVSPKAIPQMADTAEVLQQLTSTSGTKLLAIVANVRGAQEACRHERVDYLGYPFSISETFQRRNANSGIAESVDRVKEINDLCAQTGKSLRVYISMAFGNPYGDEWSGEIALRWCETLAGIGVKHLALADTVGSSNAQSIAELFTAVSSRLKDIELIAHLHSTPAQSTEKIRAAYDSGCRSFDVAVHGFGGCPMATDKLTGNIATEILEAFTAERKIGHNLKKEELEKAYAMGWEIFNTYH